MMNVSEARAVLRLMGYRLVVWIRTEGGEFSSDEKVRLPLSLVQYIYYDVVPEQCKKWPGYGYRASLLRDSAPRGTILEAKAAFLAWMERACPKEREPNA